MKISIVVPVYYEGESVRVAHDGITRVLRDRLPQYDFELIFVDDGSGDDSFSHLSALAADCPYVRVMKLAQNVGSHMAIRAGLEHATGDVACFLACDLQDPPGVIPQMLDALKAPVQIVWAVRNSRRDSVTSKLASKIFFGLARALVSKNLPPNGASMFLLGPEALRSVGRYRERNLTLEGLFATMGFPQAYVTYERGERVFGKSKWTMAKRLKLFADFFVGYSYTPIRMMSFFGLAVAALGFVYAIIVLLNKMIRGKPIQGWTSLMLVLLIMGGVQMTMLGVIGEYVWRALDETRKRPRYVIQTILNEPADSVHKSFEIER
jgi:dolichol-phosphate mannosyltransferase